MISGINVILFNILPLAFLETLQDPVQVTQISWEGTPTSCSLRLLIHSCSLLWWASKGCTHPVPGPWLGRRVGGKHHCPHPATAAATAFWLLLFIFKFLVFPGVPNPVLFSPSACPPWEVCHSTLGHYHLPFVNLWPVTPSLSSFSSELYSPMTCSHAPFRCCCGISAFCI